MKRTKRIFSLALVVALLMSFVPVARADSAALATGQTLTAEPGDTLDYAVSISGNTGLAGVCVKLYFDTSVFEVVQDSKGTPYCSRGSFADKGEIMCSATSAGCKVIWYSPTPSSGNGTLFTVRLKVNAAAAIGEYPIRLSCPPTNSVDENGNQVPITCESGKVTINALTPPTFGAASVTVVTGKTVSFPVNIIKNPGLAGCVIALDYDKTKLSLVMDSSEPSAPELTRGEFTSQGSMLANMTSTGCKVLWENGDNVNSSGTMFYLKFKTSADTVPGKYPITISYSADDTVNADGAQVHFNVNDGQVYVLADTTSVAVSYDANGGTGAPTAQTKTVGTAMALSDVIPAKEGSTFLGWSESHSAAKADYPAGGTFLKDVSVTLYAVWQKQTYAISYDANGGSAAPANQVKEYGVPLTLSSDKPSRTGYTFLGWATNNTAAVQYPSGASYSANAALALYAVWQVDTYTISYDANGGTNAPASQIKTYAVAMALSAQEPSRPNYSFAGWAEKSDAVSPEYQAGGSFSKNSSTILYAVWNPKSYKINYDANGGSGAPEAQTKLYNVSISISSVSPGRTGYDFAGWAKDSNAAAVQYSAGSIYSEDQDITLYAVWKVKTFTVSYDANGGESAPAAQIKEYGADLVLSSVIPTRSGYHFNGWGTSADAATAAYSPGGSYKNNYSIVLYALWTAEDAPTNLEVVKSYGPYHAGNEITFTPSALSATKYSYKITKDTADGEQVASSSGTFTGSIAWTPSEPGTYVFSYTAFNDEGASASNSTVLTVDAAQLPLIKGRLSWASFDGNYTLYVEWDAVEGATSYDVYLAKSPYTWNDIVYKTSVDANTLKCSFSGVTGYLRVFVIPRPHSDELNLSASDTGQFGGAKNYDILYDALEGEGAPAPQIKTVGVNLTLSQTIPTREGYRFLGWASSPSAATAEYQPKSTFSADADTTLYAVWTINDAAEEHFSITFDANGGQSAPEAQSAVKYASIVLPEQKPTRDGYVFLGWAADASAAVPDYDAGDSFSYYEDITLHAIWKQRKAIKMPQHKTATGGGFNSAAITENGDLYIWGRTYNSDNTVGTQSSPKLALSNAFSVSLPQTWLGDGSSVRQNGDYYIWGGKTQYNAKYLYNGIAANSSTDTYCTVTNDGRLLYWPHELMTENIDPNITDVQFSASPSFVIAKDNSLYLKGKDQNGNDVWNKILSDVVTCAQSYGMPDHPYTYAAIEANGDLYVWGENACGQVGNGTTTKIDTPCKILSDVVYVTFGDCTMAAIDQKGDLYLWGKNDCGQIGNGTSTNSSVPVKVLGNVTDVRVGRKSTSAITENGDLYIWGNYSQVVPAKIMSEVACVEQSVLDTYIITNNRDLYVCGYNYDGEVGNGTSGDSITTPVKVLSDMMLPSDTIRETPVTYTISFDANGGSGAPQPQTKTANIALTLSGVQPTRDGYSFLGWSESRTATAASYAPGAKYVLDTNATLFAVWHMNDVAAYLVSFDANGGTGAPAAQSKSAGTELIISTVAPTRDGYSFLGWAETSNAASAAYSGGGSYTKDASVTLYAVWQKNAVKTYTVAFDANGGVGAPAAQSKSEDADIILSSSVPTREGYSFVGWAESSSATAAAYAAGSRYSKNLGITLFAVWKALDQPKKQSVVVGTASGRAGDTVTVPVTITGNTGIAGFGLAVDYDTTAMTLTSIQKGSLLSSGNFSSNEAGKYVSWFQATNVVGDGTLLTLTFSINAGCSDGNYPVSIDLDGGLAANMTDEDSCAVSTEFVSNAVSVISTVFGDITGDGDVTVMDAVKIARSLAHLITLTAEEKKAADVTGDGAVTAADAVRIARFLVHLVDNLTPQNTAATTSSLQSDSKEAAGNAYLCGESEGNTVIYVGNAVGATGDSITVPVGIRGNPGIAGLALSIEYDSSVLKLTDIKAAPAISDGSFVMNVNDGTVTWYDSKDMAQDGTLLELVFTVLSETSGADSAVSVKCTDDKAGNISNVKPEAIPVTFEEGIVTSGKIAVGNAAITGSELKYYLASSLPTTEFGKVMVFAVFYNGTKMSGCIAGSKNIGENIVEFNSAISFDRCKIFTLDGSCVPCCKDQMAKTTS